MEHTILGTLEARLKERRGVDDLLAFLETSDYFSAPASTRYHNSFQGGLALHGWNVFSLLQERCKEEWDLSEDTVAILGLLHDICKVNFYKRTKRVRTGWTGDSGVPEWQVKDSLPLGHGEKSAIVLTRLMELTDPEVAAIRWHMMGHDPGIHFDYPNGYAFQGAVSKYPEVVMLAICDWEASFLLERREDEDEEEEED